MATPVATIDTEVVQRPGMAKLYIANCTKQRREVNYRLDFAPDGSKINFTPHSKVMIEPGQQVLLTGRSMHVSTVESVVQQLVPHGLIGVVDVPRHRGKAWMVFNTDRPVPAQIIRDVMAMNDGILTHEGIVRRKQSAVIANDMIDKTVADTFAAMGLDRDPATKVDVEFEQVEQSELGERRIEEGISVRDDAPDQPPPAREVRAQRRRGRAAA